MTLTLSPVILVKLRSPAAAASFSPTAASYGFFLHQQPHHLATPVAAASVNRCHHQRCSFLCRQRHMPSPLPHPADPRSSSSANCVVACLLSAVNLASKIGPTTPLLQPALRNRSERCFPSVPPLPPRQRARVVIAISYAESSSILPLPPRRERRRGHLFLFRTRYRHVGQDPTPDRHRSPRHCLIPSPTASTTPNADAAASSAATGSGAAASASSVSSSLYRSRASSATATADGSSRNSNCFPCILLCCCSFLSQQLTSPRSFAAPLPSVRPTSLLDRNRI
ncbi:hypothetical protein BHE74_00041198 [Ensete ventricosum]|nr:hypothetical protein BHE74_00041198 [Ensete ventricosum]